MSFTGNEIGKLLIELELITPEELATAQEEQLKSGERLTLVLEKLGYITFNQLKDTLELQFGVNFISLAKNPPEREVADLISEELKRHYQLIPTQCLGTQVTVAMVNPDDLLALDYLRITLKTGHIKKLVCTQDDFEYCLDQLYGKASQEAPVIEQSPAQPEPAIETSTPEIVPHATPASPAASAFSAGKLPGKNALKSLFDDDDDDDDLESLVRKPSAAVSQAPVQAPAPVEVTPPVPTPAPAPVAEASVPAPAPVEVTPPVSTPAPAPVTQAPVPAPAPVEVTAPVPTPAPAPVAQAPVEATAPAPVEVTPPVSTPTPAPVAQAPVPAPAPVEVTAPVPTPAPAPVAQAPVPVPAPVEVTAPVPTPAPAPVAQAPVEATAPAPVEVTAPVPTPAPAPVAQAPVEATAPAAPQLEPVKTIEAATTPVPSLDLATAEGVMETVLASVTSQLTELPMEDSQRQLLEEVIESELADIEEMDLKHIQEAQSASVMLLAHEIIGKASQKKCSDIHLEPDTTGISLRYFLHGELLAACVLPLEIHQSLVSSYKIIAGLNPAEKDKPQDKKFKTRVDDDHIELRITTMPSENGEMVAISMKFADAE